jgi:hypothetical protein
VVREPFVWEIHVRREVLDDELAQLRDLPYSLWREVMASPMTKEVLGRDNKTYRVKVTAVPATKTTDDIRVTVALQSGGGLRRTLMKKSFVITPDNQFIG